ncbi:MAG: type III pantothenate kinase [Clostridia bacterium]|nr:type III pantothenate kinase [Clostridiales bacterium]MBQ2975882.1 type III pantothenate kinase [Clostridia bacterium]MBQ6805692.1 type III pantothenate kinase [Clostridia bacterium]
MLLTMDIGNTNIKTALFDGPEMVHYWRLSTTRRYTSDEMGVMITQLFSHEGIKKEDVTGIMLSSVVPTINFTVEHMCRDYFGIDPLTVAPGIKTGIDIKYENPRELGSDRICNAVAAYTLYGGPCVYIDFGTATTFGALDENGAFLGGAICPGIKLTSEALVSGTAKLPHFELVMPEKVIGKSTIANLQSGVINGYVGQVIYLVNEIRREMGHPDAKVIATGGMARLIASKSGVIDHIDGLLTLKGLRLIYEKNQAKA